MGRFRFRMATLLRVQEAARDERRTELAQAQRAADAVQERIDELAGELSEIVQQNRQETAPGRIDVDRLLTTQRYELLLRAQQQQLEGQRQMVEREVERRREVLVSANREVRVLENLRQRQADQHRQQEQKREGAVLDEVAGQQHWRKGEV